MRKPNKRIMLHYAWKLVDNRLMKELGINVKIYTNKGQWLGSIRNHA